jgi:CBS domain containing-hemolysin-like protein
MNFTITWLFDKLGYMPKPAIQVDLQEWPFPVVKKVVAKKTAKKTVKIPKATTRKSTKK